LLEKLKSRCKTAGINSQNSNTRLAGLPGMQCVISGYDKAALAGVCGVWPRAKVSKEQRFLRE